MRDHYVISGETLRDPEIGVQVAIYWIAIGSYFDTPSQADGFFHLAGTASLHVAAFTT